jgi:hypothetical protein
MGKLDGWFLVPPHVVCSIFLVSLHLGKGGEFVSVMRGTLRVNSVTPIDVKVSICLGIELGIF